MGNEIQTREAPKGNARRLVAAIAVLSLAAAGAGVKVARDRHPASHDNSARVTAPPPTPQESQPPTAASPSPSETPSAAPTAPQKATVVGSVGIVCPYGGDAYSDTTEKDKYGDTIVKLGCVILGPGGQKDYEQPIYAFEGTGVTPTYEVRIKWDVQNGDPDWDFGKAVTNSEGGDIPNFVGIAVPAFEDVEIEKL